MTTIKLISHKLCPYVQRAVIALTEKGVAFERIDIDLSNKPDWFLKISPLGKTPVLLVDDEAIFESAVILEYLEETQPNPMHPADPLTRARQRSWMEFGSAILNDIAGFYAAPDRRTFESKMAALTDKFAKLEVALGDGPLFAGDRFSLVDAVFGPIFRYFDTFETITDLDFFAETPKVRAWRKTLSARPSIAKAVAPDYAQNLERFLRNRNAYISTLMAKAA